jgi:hypothetical protein
MSMPGFTAESSLRPVGNNYRAFGRTNTSAENQIVSALDIIEDLVKPVVRAACRAGCWAAAGAAQVACCSPPHGPATCGPCVALAGAWASVCSDAC